MDDLASLIRVKVRSAPGFPCIDEKFVSLVRREVMG
jgi:hypothetical protein